ncbi:uncharacterized secreted protein [Burkholderiales bacterium JOSHI_001]|nr:uncharacterized secreted protein [Burkholderiales bacterium JOSHI_001]
MPRPRNALTLAAALAAVLPTLAAQPACSASAKGPPPRVVELFTSEGCNSCPPADRWLSSLKGRNDVLAAAFHVDYWDRLGWRDRFASPAFTARQAALQTTSGVRYSYTPQVLVDGRDWRNWPELPSGKASATGVQLELQRQGDRLRLAVNADTASPPRLALWWAVLEDGHDSAVRAGENAGVQLHHDHVVRQHASVPAWDAKGPPKVLTLDLPTQGEAGRATRVLAVVVDAASGRTVQAAQLGPCGPLQPGA